MANLPTVNEREVLNSLKNQETLLENISRVLVKREDYSSRKEFVMKGDKRTIDEQQDKSTIRKILEAFTGIKKTTNSQEIQIKTFEETKIAKNIAQKTGLDIEFIRKSFEDNQKKKDRELLAEALKESLSTGFSKGGFLLAGLGAVLIAGFKSLSGIIANSFKAVLIPALASLGNIIKVAFKGLGALKLLDVFGGGGPGGKPKSNKFSSLPYIGAGILGGLGLFGSTSSSMGDGTLENYTPEMSKDLAEQLAKEQLFNEMLQKDTQLKQQFEAIQDIPEKNKFMTEYLEKVTKDSSSEQAKRLEEIRTNLTGQIDNSINSLNQSIDQAAGSITNLDTSKLDNLAESGKETMNSLSEGLKKLAGIVPADKILESLKDLASLKFEDPKTGKIERLDLLEVTGGLLTSMYNSAKSEMDNIKDMFNSNPINTQVNTTNVINGNNQTQPMPFPSATPNNDNPSITRYLFNNPKLF